MNSIALSGTTSTLESELKSKVIKNNVKTLRDMIYLYFILE